MKQSKIITQQPKSLENSNIVDIKLVTIQHPKTSCKLSKAIRQAEKISQVSGDGKYSDSPLYIETKKSENFLNEKNVKVTKRSHAFTSYASSYNVEILNFFNSKLQFKGPESAIKNKLTDLLSKFKSLKFLTTPVLEFKKIESDDKIYMAPFI